MCKEPRLWQLTSTIVGRPQRPSNLCYSPRQHETDHEISDDAVHNLACKYGGEVNGSSRIGDAKTGSSASCSK